MKEYTWNNEKNKKLKKERQIRLSLTERDFHLVYAKAAEPGLSYPVLLSNIVHIVFKIIILGFSVGWGEERTPTDSKRWGSLHSPQPTPKILSESL
ncbi:MAG: hypothetical protein R2941_24910 [Desulfobacterales bacterium]